MGRTATRGVLTTGASQVVRIVVQLTGIVVMARLLSPEDYGLVAAVVAIIGVAEVFRDFGLYTAAVQAASLSTQERSNLFWLNTGIGGFLTVVVLALSPAVAAFYDDPRLTALCAAMSCTFVLNGAAAQYRADLTRRFRFAALSATEIGAQVAGLALALTTAATVVSSGRVDGQWALVVQQVSQPAILLICVVAAAKWLPTRYDRATEVRPLVRFGADMVGVNVLGYASRNVDSVVIGATLGAGPLGLYNRAFQLLTLPLNQLNAPSNRVAVPVLSRLRDDRERYDRFLLFGQAALLTVTAAVLTASAALAVPLVDVALGSQWAGTAPIFQVLALAGFFQAAAYATGWVFTTTDNSRQNLWFTLATRPLTIVAVLVGSLGGVFGVAWAYTACMAVIWPIGIWWVGRAADAPVGPMLRCGLRVLTAYSVAGLASWASTDLTSGAPSLVAIGVGGLVLIVTLGAVAALWPSFRRDLSTLWRIRTIVRGAPR